MVNMLNTVGVIRNGEDNGQLVKLFEFVNRRGEVYKVYMCGHRFTAYRLEPHHLLELDAKNLKGFANWLKEIMDL